MSAETKIQWATHTFNPWEGCTKVSPGCAHCYAETRNHRFGMDNWGKGKPRRRTSAATWKNPVKWDKMTGDGKCQGCGTVFAPVVAKYIVNQSTCSECHGEVVYTRNRVFPSLCDPLDDEVPIEWFADFLKLIYQTGNLDWLLLSKRPENWDKRIEAVCRLWACDGGYHETIEAQAYHNMLVPWRNGQPPENVWIGFSAENQEHLEARFESARDIPCKQLFISIEPLLGGVHLSAEILLHDPWVIVGGESGPQARPCKVEWVRSIVQQCGAAGVPCFVKQLGKLPIREDGVVYWQSIHPKGGEPAEWPADLRVREFPS